MSFKHWNVSLFATALLVVSLVAFPAVAQQVQVGDQEGLVNVNISNVRVDIARNINVNVNQVPVTVQAPISVAANVCNVAVNVLADQVQAGEASCEAQSTSEALNEIVQEQIQRE